MNGPLLYVENDDNDIFLFERALRRIQFPHPFRTLMGGREAIAYLSGDGPYADRTRHPLPAVLVLDLKMPEVSGMDVLRWVGARPGLAAMSVFMFSSSTQPGDVAVAKAAGANGYIVKPGTPRELEDVLRQLQQAIDQPEDIDWLYVGGAETTVPSTAP